MVKTLIKKVKKSEKGIAESLIFAPAN